MNLFYRVFVRLFAQLPTLATLQKDALPFSQLQIGLASRVECVRIDQRGQVHNEEEGSRWTHFVRVSRDACPRVGRDSAESYKFFFFFLFFCWTSQTRTNWKLTTTTREREWRDLNTRTKKKKDCWILWSSRAMNYGHPSHNGIFCEETRIMKSWHAIHHGFTIQCSDLLAQWKMGKKHAISFFPLHKTRKKKSSQKNHFLSL